jgi:SAM-dependent methyltransferase
MNRDRPFPDRSGTRDPGNRLTGSMVAEAVPEPRSGEMRLGRLEFMAMNNPVRRFIQKQVEFLTFTRFLEKRGVDLKGAVIMDAGCGSGYSTELIVKRFSPSRVIAFDIMPEQIERAKKRAAGVGFFTGDVTNLDGRYRNCDAVFVFGIIHHIPAWQKALDEISAALRSGGHLLIEEPEVGRMRRAQLEQGMEKAGFEILEREDILSGLLRSYLCRKN